MGYNTYSFLDANINLYTGLYCDYVDLHNEFFLYNHIYLFGKNTVFSNIIPGRDFVKIVIICTYLPFLHTFDLFLHFHALSYFKPNLGIFLNISYLIIHISFIFLHYIIEILNTILLIGYFLISHFYKFNDPTLFKYPLFLDYFENLAFIINSIYYDFLDLRTFKFSTSFL